MQPENFYTVGEFISSGKVVISDACFAFQHKGRKPVKHHVINLPKGKYQVLAASVSYKFGTHDAQGIIALVIKPKRKKLNFKNLTLLNKDKSTVASGNLSVMNAPLWKSLAKNKDAVQEIIESTMDTPESKVLTKRDADEYGWFKFLHLDPKYISCMTMNGDCGYQAYQNGSTIIISFEPLFSDWTKYTFHRSLTEFYKIRGEMIRTNLLKRLDPFIQLERMSKASEQETLDVISSIYGDFSPKTTKLIQEKVKLAYSK